MANEARKRSVSLDSLLRSAQLPALPQSAIRMLELSKDPQNGPAEFAVPIEADPGLTGQVLRFVNSSYFGFSREISSVKLGITMVGVRTIKNFALWSAVFSILPNPKCGPFDLKSLWQDSLRRGLFARALGKLMQVAQVEELFAAALLQDMAVPLLAKELAGDYVELLQRRQGGKVRLSTLEADRFGWTHAEAASLLVNQWNLPEEFAVYLGQHTSIEQQMASAGAQPASVAVAMSALLPSAVDQVWHECAAFESYYEKLSGDFEPSLAQLLEQVDRDFAEFAPVLKLRSPAKTLRERLEEAAQPAS